MTKEQVIELAKQAGIDSMPPDMNYRSPYYACTLDEIERFATLVRNAALDEAKQLAWTEIMREGALVTWGDAETLGDRVSEKLESLKEPTP